MSALRAIAFALLVAHAGACTRILDYPSSGSEDDEQTCADGIDNDLNGETDCADPDCVLLCPRTDVVAPAAITPCFTQGEYGFRQIAGVGDLETVCEPFPPDPPGCLAGEALLPIAGVDTCTRLGAACPAAGLFPAGLPSGGVAYVRAGATGTGTSASPFGTIGEALESGAGTVAIAAGTYNEDLVLDRSVEIVGACPTQVTLAGGVFAAPVVRVASTGVSLAQLTISPGSGSGVEVQAGGALVLHDAEVRGPADVGVGVLEGGAATLTRVAFADVTGEASVGLRVAASSTASVVGSRFDRIEGLAMDVEGTLDVTATVVTTSGGGARVGAGGHATFTGVDLEPGGGVALDVDCMRDVAAPCAVVTGSVVRDPGTAGHGLRVRSGRVDVKKTLFAGLLGWAIRGEGGIVDLEDVIVRSTRPELGEGSGIVSMPGGTVRGTRVRLRGNLFRGVTAIGGVVTLNDLELDGDQQTGTSGVGVRATEGSSLILMRFNIHSAGICGLELLGDVQFLGVEGVISDTARGACVEGDFVTVASLTSLITYIGNGQNLFVP